MTWGAEPFPLLIAPFFQFLKDHAASSFRALFDVRFHRSVEFESDMDACIVLCRTEIGQTPLMLASKKGDIEMVKVLLASGARTLAR